jgi:hypothetical protein
MEVDIKPVESTEVAVIQKKLEEEGGMDDVDSMDIDAAYSFWGHISLCGGDAPEDKHQHFKELFPDKQIASRWLDLDAHDWDVEIPYEEDDGET